MVLGTGQKDVIALVAERVRHGRAHRPACKLGLVVEGGAMRGAYTAGSLLGLHLLGASEVFDAAYATSAGAINTAHFLSGVGDRKAATYYRALADGRFYNPRRLPRPVDVDFLFDIVLRQEIPLEVERLRQSSTPFKVAVLNCRTGEGEMKLVDWNASSAWDVLKAAVAMPVVYNRRIRLDGADYVDGGMAIPYPLQAAIDDGMTDLVVLLAQDPTHPVQPRRFWHYLLWWAVFARGQPTLNRVFRQWRRTLDGLNDVVCARTARAGSPRILAVAPGEPRVRSSTMDRTLLRAACIDLAGEVLDAFGASRELVTSLVDKDVL